MLRQRKLNLHRKRDRNYHPIGALEGDAREDVRLLGRTKPEAFFESKESATTNMSHLLRKQPVWLLLAIASGICAAFNGVFAKL
jgi:hypothetical protein